MEAVNESSRLVAKALGMLKSILECGLGGDELNDPIALLEEALVSLTDAI